MITIQRSDVELVEPGHYITEASDIRLPPGPPPETITVTWPASVLGGSTFATQMFHLVGSIRDRDGDVLLWDYATIRGTAYLTIYND